MTKLTDTQRSELSATVQRILGAETDLRALAREMSEASGAIRTRAWIAARSATEGQITDLEAALSTVANHEPDLTLFTANEGSPIYMRRWWLEREIDEYGHGYDGLYVHRFENDDPAVFHNHPWPSSSLLLHGGPIFEDTSEGTSIIYNRKVVLRPAGHRHRIRLRPGQMLNDLSVSRIPAMTLFATGKRVQEWGFERTDGSIDPVPSTTGATPRR